MFSSAELLVPHVHIVHWFDSHQEFPHTTNASIISSACWNSWNVDVTVDKGVGAILQRELDMQGHTYLGDG